jgi:hypothetical protein
MEGVAFLKLEGILPRFETESKLEVQSIMMSDSFNLLKTQGPELEEDGSSLPQLIQHCKDLNESL